MMTLQTPHSLDGVNSRHLAVAPAYAPWFDARYVIDYNIFMSYVRGDCLPDDIALFALHCDK